MKITPTYRWLIGVFAALFISLQTGAIVHATVYADAAHDHNGMVCEVEAVAADAQIILPPAAISDGLPPTETEPTTAAYISASYITPQGRAPPPRSPPFLF